MLLIMESALSNQTVSNASLWTGRIISTLIILFMLFDGGAKVVRFAPYVEGTVKAGFADSLVVPLGIVSLVCTILYAIPQTSILGGILLAAYFGGATATHGGPGSAF